MTFRPTFRITLTAQPLPLKQAALFATQRIEANEPECDHAPLRELQRTFAGRMARLCSKCLRTIDECEGTK